jgi:hypothetical protein
MPEPILSTKLFIPPLRSRGVARSRLNQKLNQGLECGLVLVSAPAGYGKSTLLSAWLSHLEYPVESIYLSGRTRPAGARLGVSHAKDRQCVGFDPIPRRHRYPDYARNFFELEMRVCFEESIGGY